MQDSEEEQEAVARQPEPALGKHKVQSSIINSNNIINSINSY